jgi:hypothetical protein
LTAQFKKRAESCVFFPCHSGRQRIDQTADYADEQAKPEGVKETAYG